MIDYKQCQEKTDQELIVLALTSQDYFLCIIKRYEVKLLKYILRISSVDESQAEDILQTVFIKIYENLNDYDPSLKFSSWIYRITHNQVISTYRRNKARPQVISIDKNDEFLKNVASSIDIINEIDLKFLQKNINKILTKMDEKYKEILILKYLEEKDYKEMSDILQKPIGTIATLINRAKKQFRKIVIETNIKF